MWQRPKSQYDRSFEQKVRAALECISREAASPRGAHSSPEAAIAHAERKEIWQTIVEAGRMDQSMKTILEERLQMRKLRKELELLRKNGDASAMAQKKEELDKLVTQLNLKV